ncbi:hypothetical protein THRCLA_01962 [Thraustotheca clavata]|uniref:RING-type domain-containing protein n=1 Tax=Thraustotheca clavata TaxID=74557 RepID=A0A1W0A6X9_9STRA|nr:hypothetical protein THRCLA_01962 [Thraustotheca clavata]
MSKGVHVNVNIQYKALPHAVVANVVQVFESTNWANFMIQYIVPHLKAYTPTSNAILNHLDAWKRENQSQDDPCGICMCGMENANECIVLPCQHAFHLSCIRQWLTRRNTCPYCRHEFQKELSGHYAITRIQTTLLLDENIPLEMPVGGQIMNAVVQMTLVQTYTNQMHLGYEILVNINKNLLASSITQQNPRKRSMSIVAAAETLKRLRTG